MSFTPRRTAPKDSDKWWISRQKSVEGCNPCVAAKGNSVLPSIVGYAHGRFDEVLGRASQLACGSPGQMYLYVEDGYQRGSEPQLGAVACWSGSLDNGHVAIVEKIDKNGMITTSEYSSLYNRWTTVDRYPPHYITDMEQSRIFQGFIYNPAIVGQTDKASEFLRIACTQIGLNSVWTIKNSGLQASGWSAAFVVACAKQSRIADSIIYSSASASTVLEMSVG